MNLQSTAETISSWINSCTKPEQVGLCADAVDKFIFERFFHHVPTAEFSMVHSDLLIQIATKAKELNQEPQKN